MANCRPTVLFALPLAYSAPFQFGFVNYALAMAVALLMFGLWMQLGRLRYFRLRAVLFVPLGFVLWTIHAYGWGVLGLLVFIANCVEARKEGISWGKTIATGIIGSLPLAPPALLLLDWGGNPAGYATTRGFFQAPEKLISALSILRNANFPFDVASALLLYLLLLGAARIAFRFNATLGASAIALFVIFLILPEVLLGSAFAAMRLHPSRSPWPCLPSCLSAAGGGSSWWRLRDAYSSRSGSGSKRFAMLRLIGIGVDRSRRSIMFRVGRASSRWPMPHALVIGVRGAWRHWAGSALCGRKLS